MHRNPHRRNLGTVAPRPGLEQNAQNALAAMHDSIFKGRFLLSGANAPPVRNADQNDPSYTVGLRVTASASPSPLVVGLSCQLFRISKLYGFKFHFNQD